MRRIQLVHWNTAEAEERAMWLQAAGYEVAHGPPDGAGWLRQLRDDPPSAVVIDLGRLPSHGRDVGLAIRESRSTRHLPLVFVQGNAEKVARIKQLLPDAVYTTWSGVSSALEQAIADPPADPVVPRSRLEGYSGTPLPKKLGIKANTVVSLVGAPEGFEETLGELPEGVVLRRRTRGRSDLTLWFTTSRKELERRIERMGAFDDRGPLWIVWPCRSSAILSA